MQEMRNAYKIFLGKPERKGPLGRLGVDWSIILKLNLVLTSLESVDLTHLAQDRDGGGLL
jgi:hypothetical protein